MIWEKGKYFLFPWLLFFAIGLSSVLFLGKTELHIVLNGIQPRFADTYFKIITRFGEGLAISLGILYLLFRSRKGAMFLATAWLSTFLMILFLKNVFDALRPASVFKNSDAIYFVEGVKYHFTHSFPSGHTGEIFAVCFALTLLSRKSTYGWLLFIPAILVGYSRVFLSQHFMEDILAGSFVAISCTSISFYLWWRNSENFRRYIDRH